MEIIDDDMKQYRLLVRTSSKSVGRSAYVSSIVSDAKFLYPSRINEDEVCEALGALSSMIDEMDLTINRNTKCKGEMLPKRYTDDYRSLLVSNLPGTEVVLSLTFVECD